MTHLSDPTLNEYLDHALDDKAQKVIQAHLETCQNCLQRLDNLRGVFAALEEIQEQDLPHDLALSILKRLPAARKNMFWKYALPAQAGLALAIAAWLARLGGGILPLPSRDSLLSIFLSPLCEGWVALHAWQEQTTAALPRLTLPLPPIAFRMEGLFWLVLAAAGLAFIIGNLSLLRGNGREI